MDVVADTFFIQAMAHGNDERAELIGARQPATAGKGLQVGIDRNHGPRNCTE